MFVMSHVCAIFCRSEKFKISIQSQFNHISSYGDKYNGYNIQSNLRSTTLTWVQSEVGMASCILGVKSFFLIKLPKKVLRGAKFPLNIC